LSNNPPDDAKPLSKREEERLLEAGRSVFSTAFPNPNREGCPPQDLIEALARGKASLAQHRDFILHMSRCSPCYNDFDRFRKVAQREMRIKLLAAAAVIAIFCVAAWLLVRARRGAPHEYAAAFDMSTQLMFRGFGGSRAQSKGPMVLRRGIADLTLYLPPGSRTGPYEVGVLTESERVLITVPGSAAVNGTKPALTARLDVSRLSPGHYLLGIRPPGADWSLSPLVVK
jgi:hypothetical protein